MEKRLAKVHIKEFSRKIADKQGKGAGFDVKLLEGDVNWTAVMKSLDDIGYHGWTTVEQPGGDTREGLKDLCDRLIKIQELITQQPEDHLPELLTKAICLLSGDHEVHLLFPGHHRDKLSLSVHRRKQASFSASHAYTKDDRWQCTSRLNDIKTIHFPSGEMCGNQLLYLSNVSCSLPVPSGFIRQICIVPV